MRKTNQITYNIPRGTGFESTSISGFKGLQLSDNPLSVDPNSSLDMKNVYLNDSGSLCTRPRIEYEKSYVLSNNNYYYYGSSTSTSMAMNEIINYTTLNDYINIIQAKKSNVIILIIERTINGTIRRDIVKNETNITISPSKVTAFLKNDKIYILNGSSYLVIKPTTTLTTVACNFEIFDLISDIDTYTPNIYVDSIKTSENINMLNKNYTNIYTFDPKTDMTNKHTSDFVSINNKYMENIDVNSEQEYNNNISYADAYIDSARVNYITRYGYKVITTFGAHSSDRFITLIDNNNNIIKSFDCYDSDPRLFMGCDEKLKYIIICVYPINTSNKKTMYIIDVDSDTSCLLENFPSNAIYPYGFAYINEDATKIIVRLLQDIAISYFNKVSLYTRENAGSISSYDTFTRTDLKSYTEYLIDDGYISVFPNEDFSIIYCSYNDGSHKFTYTGTGYSSSKISDNYIYDIDVFNNENRFYPRREIFSNNLKYFLKYYQDNKFKLSKIVNDELINYVVPIEIGFDLDTHLVDYNITDEGLIYLLIKNTHDFHPSEEYTYQYNMDTNEYILINTFKHPLGVPLISRIINLYDLSNVYITFTRSLTDNTRVITFHFNSFKSLIIPSFNITYYSLDNLQTFNINKYTTFNNNYWFYGNSNKLWYTNNNDPTYIGEFNYIDVGDSKQVTGLLVISDSILMAFKEDKIFIIQANVLENDIIYTCTEVKGDVGNIPVGQALITKHSEVPLMIDDSGVYTIKQLTNVTLSEHTTQSISFNMDKKFIKEINKDKIITHNYLYWTYLIFPGATAKVYVLDNRTFEWYYWELPEGNIVSIWNVTENVDGLLYQISQYITKEGNVYSLRTIDKLNQIDFTNSNEYYTSYNDILLEGEVGIEWFWESQILPLNLTKYSKGYSALGYSKVLYETNFLFTDTDADDEFSLKYSFKAYRKMLSDAGTKSTNGTLNYIRSVTQRTYIPRFSFLQVKLENNEFNNDYQTNIPNHNNKLNLIQLKFKYKLMEEIK